ncbi:MAG: methyltransferase domain-containing protein [Alphaproteobacteria bacterium]|nr:methyltransferase domain-containing protein [Alphaproteobacteria bacterium]
MAIGATERMDRMYRHQRHVYDLTRKWFLFGRDALIDRLAPPSGAHVCEMGCGTARNILRMARRYPWARLYGLDASGEMLKTAQARVARARLDGRVQLRHGLAEFRESYAQFGPSAGFDAVVLSYVLSMVPDWRGALDAAVGAVRPGGAVGLVDFHDVDRLPWPLAPGLRSWLARFDVTPRPEALDHLAALERQGLGRAETRTVLGGYAFLARFVRAS